MVSGLLVPAAVLDSQPDIDNSLHDWVVGHSLGITLPVSFGLFSDEVFEFAR